MRAIYRTLVRIIFRSYCWLFRFNGMVSTHRMQTIDAKLIAQILHGYYPYLDKVLLDVSWDRHYEAIRPSGAGTGSFYYIVKLKWGPARLSPATKYYRELSDLDLATFTDSLISAKLIRL